jgi:putative phage-type endonuclease
MILKIKPDSREHWLSMRKKVINSTDVACLFGVSPYKTYYQLWNEKNGILDEDVKYTELMQWGNKLEPVIASSVGEKLNAEVVKMEEFVYDTELRIGASFDYIVKGDGKCECGCEREAHIELSYKCAVHGECPQACKLYRDKNLMIVEIKNTSERSFARYWTPTSMPKHIELQVQHQMLLLQAKRCVVGVLAGGNELYIYEREANPTVMQMILDKVAEFWAVKECPKPDYEADVETITKIYNFAEPNTVLDASEDAEMTALANSYKKLSADKKIIENRMAEVKARCLEIIGSNEKVIGGFYSISAGLVGECEIAYTRKGYRDFRFNFKKEK